MKFIASVFVLFSLQAHAETLTMNIEGMHCGGCTAAVEATACKDKGYKSCKAEIVDAEKKLGRIIIETKRGEKVDLSKVTADVKATKYTPKDHKVTQ